MDKPTESPVRVKLPHMAPAWIALALAVPIVALVFAVAWLRVISTEDAYGTVALSLFSVLVLCFVRPGWIEFDGSRTSVRFVSIVRRQFNVLTWPVTLETPPTIPLSPTTEIVVGRRNFQCSIRTRECDGTEKVICSTSPFTFPQAIALARSIETSSGIRASVQPNVGKPAEPESEWTEESDRRTRRNVVLIWMVYAGLIIAGTAALSHHVHR
jgi:hypothetical protein